jgi:uncharacterized protein (DUF2164 family)
LGQHAAGNQQKKSNGAKHMRSLRLICFNVYDCGWRPGGKMAPPRGDFAMTPTLELPKPTRATAVASLKRYFEEELSEPIGDLKAGLLLNYILEEIGPLVYNHAIADAQARLAARVADLNGELFADELQYWPRVDAKRRKH